MRDEFATRGFVSLADFAGPDEIAEINRAVDRLIAEVVPGLPREVVYFEDRSDPSTLKQIQRLSDHDPFFAGLLTGSRYEALAAELLGEPVLGRNLQFFDKPSGSIRGTPPHQDGFYFMLEPCRAVTMWLALEDVGEDQGCVRYVAGSHRRGMRHHRRSDVLGFSQYIPDFGTPEDLADEIAMPCRAGHLLVHHALTIHRADANSSAGRSRRALGFVYYAASAREDAVAHAAYQERLRVRLAQSGRI